MAQLPRATKIVATLGPASSSPEMIEKLIQAGVNVVRLNFSHGTADDHRSRAALVRAAAERLGVDIGVLVDLQGPKIRVGKFAGGKVTLASGASFTFDLDCELGDVQHVGLDYKELVNDVAAGDTLLLNDGQMSMQVEKVTPKTITCTVIEGGVLSDRKGINRLGGGLSAPALTEKDMADIRVAAELEADFLAVSFPKDAADLTLARRLMQAAGGRAAIVAKIERVEAIDNLQAIIDAADAIMVARGDLAVEVGDAAVPALQKRMIRMARESNCVTITATQMMESMIHSPVPTRAEVSDVANAVLDGSDAVMLSAETASGSFPVQTVQAMARVCLEAEKSEPITLESEFLDRTFDRVDQSIAMASLFTARHLKVKAIASLTESGSTALWMSRLNSGVPVYALTPVQASRRRMALYRDVTPVFFDYNSREREEILREAEQRLVDEGVVTTDDLLIITIGEPIGQSGGTNTMKIVRVVAKPRAGSKAASK
ncbi:MAG: pyruvate kinase [Betaproteobacteria bacterium]|jgi:pyruvate kinase|nr:pyruvate kinase [Betaproteobacteria bacterium]